jgi:hypothetical protein
MGQPDERFLDEVHGADLPGWKALKDGFLDARHGSQSRVRAGVLRQVESGAPGVPQGGCHGPGDTGQAPDSRKVTEALVADVSESGRYRAGQVVRIDRGQKAAGETSSKSFDRSHSCAAAGAGAGQFQPYSLELRTG